MPYVRDGRVQEEGEGAATLLSAGRAVAGMARIETPLCDALGIDCPIVQAPIGSASTPELAAAVADAGALGTLAMSWRDGDEIRECYADATARTDGVVAANVVLDEDAGVLPPGECLETCLDAGAEVVSFSFGDPERYVERVHEAGGTALATVGSAEAAREAVAAGADAVVAQGWEAGGHVQSDVASMALLPRVADAVDVPVVAAGGVSDGRGLAAALALGADGAWLGTRFVATPESGAHERYREAVSGADETDTAYTDLFDGGWPGQPHRVLETETVERWREAGEPDTGERPGEGETVARTPDGDPVERYDDLPPVAGVDGDVSALPHYAGQSAGGTDEVVDAETVVERVVADAVAAVDEVGSLVAQ